MSSGGGNALENVFNSATTAASDVAGLVGLEDLALVDDIAREAQPFYDEVSGENARKKKSAEQQAKKDAAKAISDQKAKVKAGEADKANKEDLTKKRSIAKSKQVKRKKTGRRSTILTDNLGTPGGEENQAKKSLLGL